MHFMNIIIIEHDDTEYNRLFEALHHVPEPAKITRAKSKNSGLKLIKEEIAKYSPIDLIICDDYIPTFDEDDGMKPLNSANDIIAHVNRLDKYIPVCVCSDDETDRFNSRYVIRYDASSSIELIATKLYKVIVETKEKKRVLAKQIDHSQTTNKPKMK